MEEGTVFLWKKGWFPREEEMVYREEEWVSHGGRNSFPIRGRNGFSIKEGKVSRGGMYSFSWWEEWFSHVERSGFPTEEGMGFPWKMEWLPHVYPLFLWVLRESHFV